MSFLEELKRRNVVRVGVVYLITAWLLAQVADLLLENFNAPDWVIQAILVVLILGFPLALIFAWAFELTPEGLKKEKDVDRSQSITPVTGRKLDRAIIVVLVVALGYFIWESRVQHQDAEAPEPQAAAEPAPDGAAQKSIAVLPFVNMSSDAEQEYFSDGISEEILNSLAKVKELKVAGRTSSFAFKGQNQDLRQIGDTLGVEHILEGSVRKSGATVRITAQLIQVDDGFHLWSETYDRELTDIFAIQDEISSAILEQLKAHLVGLAETPAPAAAERTDSEVYDRYLLARQRIYERKRLAIESAAELLDKAIAADPEYAPAYAQRGISALLLSEASYGELANSEAMSQGKLYLDKALQLDPDLAEAWAGLGLYHSNRPGEYPQAIEALEKALALNPNLIDASNWLQIAYGETGDNRRALAILEEMVARDPLYPPGYSNAIYVYNFFDMQDKSWALLERVRPFMPGDPQVLQAEARIWMSVARPAKALTLLEQAHAAQPDDRVTTDMWSYALLGTAQFERAAEEGSPWARVLAMTRLGRGEEARLLAGQLAGEGLVWPMLAHLVVTGQYAALAQFVESRWADLAAFEAENPDSGDGYGAMLDIAVAYARLGDEQRFENAMRRVRAAHDRALLQFPDHAGLLFGEARYFALLGDTEQAISYLERAMEHHFRRSVPLHEITPEMEPLRGDPRYEAVLARMQELVNAERAELGLEPLNT